MPAGCVLATHGSDEAIDLLSRIYLRAGTDAILQCAPTFGMYQSAAHIQGAGVIEIPLERAHGWSLDPERLLAAWQPGVKIVYLCSPNNPTGNLLDIGALEAVCSALDGKAIVVIDEAYIEWSRRASLTAWLARFSTLAILRTLSKAHALAGARIGALLAHPELIQLARRIIPPYSLAQPAIEAALARTRAAASSPPRSRGSRRCSGARISARAVARLALGREGVAERCEFPADRLPRCRSIHALEHRRRLDRARPAQPSGTAQFAAHLGGHASRERCAAREPGGGVSG